MKFEVRIFEISNPANQKTIEIEQFDRTGIASSPEIPSGWAFQLAYPEDIHK